MKETAKIQSVIAIFFGLPFLFFGTAATVWGVIIVKNAKSTESWTQTDGVVTASKITRRSRSRTTGGTSRQRQNNTNRKTTYGANITYDYTIDGKIYTSDRFSYGSYRSGDRSHAAGIVAEFPVGKKVPVFYDPNDPESAVLEKGASALVYLPVGIGSLLILIGGTATIRGFTRFRKS